MTDINNVVIVGRLAADGVLKYTAGGMAILTFTVAVNRSRKGGDGNYVDDVSFIECDQFGKMGESLKPYMTKGKQVAVSGWIKQQRWEKDGQKHSKVTIGADNVQLLGGGSTAANNQGSYKEQQAEYANQQNDEEIPFF